MHQLLAVMDVCLVPLLTLKYAVSVKQVSTFLKTTSAWSVLPQVSAKLAHHKTQQSVWAAILGPSLTAIQSVFHALSLALLASTIIQPSAQLALRDMCLSKTATYVNKQQISLETSILLPWKTVQIQNSQPQTEITQLLAHFVLKDLHLLHKDVLLALLDVKFATLLTWQSASNVLLAFNSIWITSVQQFRLVPKTAFPAVQ